MNDEQNKLEITLDIDKEKDNYKKWKKETVTIDYIEKEVESINLDGFQVVRRENFAKIQCPALTIKYGKIYFNLKAIRKLDEATHIQILINKEEKKLIVRASEESSKEALKWSYYDKNGKLYKKDIGARGFTAKLFRDMGWDPACTVKCLGTLIKCKDEKIFLFELDNNEMYMNLSVPDANNENKKIRVAYEPKQWEHNYGKPVTEYDTELIKTLEDVPEGFVVFCQTPPEPKKSSTIDDHNRSEREVTDGDIRQNSD